MPATVNQNTIQFDSNGSQSTTTGTFAFTTYETGGVVLNAPNFRLSRMRALQTVNRDGYKFDVIFNNGGESVNILAFDSLSTETANSTDLSGLGDIPFSALGL